jgi:hypothetical protein
MRLTSYDELERAVLAEAITRPRALELAVDVETLDFERYDRRAVWTALRNLQAAQRPIDVLAIAAAMTERYRFTWEATNRGEAPTMRFEVDVLAQLVHTMPVRLMGERDERHDHAGRALHYHHPFLDDVPARDPAARPDPARRADGLGKTDLALSIATGNALKERRVGYFALEAEPRELERRTKFAWISRAYRRNIEQGRAELRRLVLLHRCEDIVGDLDEEADRGLRCRTSALWTFYRGEHFGANDLKKRDREVPPQAVDLIVVDHLHYVDFDDDDNEARAIGDTVKVIRDVSLRIGKPVILVAHLRKRDERLKQLMPTLDDFHGSSNITKICTQAITLEPRAHVDRGAEVVARADVHVGAQGSPRRRAAVRRADDVRPRTRRYEDTYTLGRLVKGGTEWEQIKLADRPGWASGFKQMEMDRRATAGCADAHRCRCSGRPDAHRRGERRHDRHG